MNHAVRNPGSGQMRVEPESETSGSDWIRVVYTSSPARVKVKPEVDNSGSNQKQVQVNLNSMSLFDLFLFFFLA